MDVNTLISRIQNPALVANDDVTLWQEVSERFPYFSIGRYLEYINQSNHEKEANIQLVSMYKHNPMVFAQRLRPIKDTDIIHNTMPEVTPPSWTAPEPEPIIMPELKVEKEETFMPELKVVKEEPILHEIPVWNEPAPPEIIDQVELVEHPHKVHDIEDYITSQAEGIADEHEVGITEDHLILDDTVPREAEDKSLMVMMSFMDWIEHFHKKNMDELEEEKEKRALRTAWQKEKLNAIVDEESDEIPESIFRQAMESVSSESGIVSEPLAQLLAQQGKTERAIEMYKKLSLRNPEKSTYFADLIRKIHLNNH